MSKLSVHFWAQQTFILCRAVCEEAGVMASEKWVSAILLLQLCYTGCGFCEKVLVWPRGMSHWLNLKVILEKLMERGHKVTMLVSPQNFTIDYSKPSTMNFKILPMPQDRKANENRLHDFLDLSVNVMPSLSPWQLAKSARIFFFK